MSFGKDTSQISRIGGYGASSSQQMSNAMRRQGGGRKGAPSWADNFKPSENQPDLIRIIPGSYEAERVDNNGNVFTETVAWYECSEHYHGGIKKSSVCSAGVFRMDKKKAKPCRGCDIYWADYRERVRIESETGIKPKGPNRISFSSKYVFNVIDMGYFYKTEDLDENHRVRINQQTQQPYMRWVKYIGPQQDAAFHMAKEKRQGRVLSWPVGFNHFATLCTYADMCQKHCVNCGQQNCIYVMGYSCPVCSAPTLGQQDSSLAPDKVKELVSQPVTCRNCRQSAYPQAHMNCHSCGKPNPANIFSVDIQVQRVKARENSSQLIIPWVSAPKPIDPQYSELLKYLIDLPKKFAPTPLEEQGAIYGDAGGQSVPAPNGYQQPGYQQPAYQQPGYQQGYGQPPPTNQAPAYAPQGYMPNYPDPNQYAYSYGANAQQPIQQPATHYQAPPQQALTPPYNGYNGGYGQ